MIFNIVCRGREKEREEEGERGERNSRAGNVYVYMCVCLTKKKVFYAESREEFIKKGLKSFFILILYSIIYHHFPIKYSCKCKDDNNIYIYPSIY